MDVTFASPPRTYRLPACHGADFICDGLAAWFRRFCVIPCVIPCVVPCVVLLLLAAVAVAEKDGDCVTVPLLDPVLTAEDRRVHRGMPRAIAAQPDKAAWAPASSNVMS